ncbi:MAG: oxygen-insensitive NAD(P)H nitroreductase [Vibrionaceae bacterium]
MDIMQALQSRYSTKEFDKNRKLTKQQVSDLKELARLSASSVNSQPWHFLLASTPEGKARVAKAVQGPFSFNENKVLNASHVMVFCVKKELSDAYLTQLLEQEQRDGRFADQEAAKMMDGARRHFVKLHREDLKDAKSWQQKQVYLNVGSFVMGAAAMGIDTLVMEGFDAQALDAEFDLKSKGLEGLLLVALGHHSESDFNAKLPKSRLPVEAVVTEI